MVELLRGRVVHGHWKEQACWTESSLLLSLTTLFVKTAATCLCVRACLCGCGRGDCCLILHCVPQVARCHACKRQGKLLETVHWRGEIKHFCNQHCLLRFYSQQNQPNLATQKGPESLLNSKWGRESRML